MKNSTHSTSKSTVSSALQGKKISKGLVKFHLKGGKPMKKSLSELADEEVELEKEKLDGLQE